MYVLYNIDALIVMCPLISQNVHVPAVYRYSILLCAARYNCSTDDLEVMVVVTEQDLMLILYAVYRKCILSDTYLYSVSMNTIIINDKKQSYVFFSLLPIHL